MPVFRLSLISLLMSAGVTACTDARTTTGSKQFECKVDEQCILSGRLILHRGVPANAAVLEQGDNCLPLALDASIFSNFNAWNRRYVRVEGGGYSPPDIEGLMWYEFRGRKMAKGVCDRPVTIFVDRIDK